MKQELINQCEQYYKNIEGYKYPYRDQMVGCFILCDKLDEKINRFLKEKNATILLFGKNEIRANIDNTFWEIQEINESHLRHQGCRYYKVYIDTRIADELMRTDIMPGMAGYCKEVHFF